MRVSDFLNFYNIVIQCHDNPDADAIASGYCLYRYLKRKGKNVRFVYSGNFKISKTNLTYFISQLKIPLEYVKKLEVAPELLILIDCQYDGGNVAHFEANEIAVIDHHQSTGDQPLMRDIRTNIGSCSTIVWDLLSHEADYKLDKSEQTALYYGLYTDTSAFSEIAHPLDRDMRDTLVINKALLTRLRNMNLTLNEAKIAGIGLLGIEYYEEHKYAILKTEPCDPNILGLISDFLIAVDCIDVCLVYNVLPFGVKYSIRSCSVETKADELAKFISGTIGSGGGHSEKAGGFLQTELLEKRYPRYAKAVDSNKPNIIIELLRSKMNQYFKNFDILYIGRSRINTNEMHICKKKAVTLGYMFPSKLIKPGQEAIIRTLDGDISLEITEDTVIMIGIAGEVFPISRADFTRNYQQIDQELSLHLEYRPTIKNAETNSVYPLLDNARPCMSTDSAKLYVQQITKAVKIFRQEDPDHYMLGERGDYLAISTDNSNDVTIIKKNIFKKNYIQVD